jgi:hypothetical protein
MERSRLERIPYIHGEVYVRRSLITRVVVTDDGDTNYWIDGKIHTAFSVLHQRKVAEWLLGEAEWLLGEAEWL